VLCMVIKKYAGDPKWCYKKWSEKVHTPLGNNPIPLVEGLCGSFKRDGSDYMLGHEVDCTLKCTTLVKNIAR
jgi:hypothetical protein